MCVCVCDDCAFARLRFCSLRNSGGGNMHSWTFLEVDAGQSTSWNPVIGNRHGGPEEHKKWCVLSSRLKSKSIRSSSSTWGSSPR